MGILNVNKISFSPVSPKDVFNIGSEGESNSLYIRRGIGETTEGLIAHIQGEKEGDFNQHEVYFHKKVHFIDGVDMEEGSIIGDMFADESIPPSKLAAWGKGDVERIIPTNSIAWNKIIAPTELKDLSHIDADTVDGKHASEFALRADVLEDIKNIINTLGPVTNVELSKMISGGGSSQLELHGNGVQVPSILKVKALNTSNLGGVLWMQNRVDGSPNSIVYNVNDSTKANDSRLVLGGVVPNDDVGTLYDNATGNSVGPSIKLWHSKNLIELESADVKMSGSLSVANNISAKSLTIGGKEISTTAFDSKYQSKLTGSVGNAETPVYLSNGVITAGTATETIAKGVCTVISGNRGNLAGYSNAPVSNVNSIDENSRDDIVISTGMTVTLKGNPGVCWCKTISINTASNVALSFSGVWKYAGDTVPSIKQYDVITAYWNGSFGKIFIS